MSTGRGILAQADTDIEIAWRTKPSTDSSSVPNGDMLGALTDPDEYTVVSYVPQFNTDQLRAAGSDFPTEITSRYLGLPEDTPERVLALARELTQGRPNTLRPRCRYRNLPSQLSVHAGGRAAPAGPRCGRLLPVHGATRLLRLLFHLHGRARARCRAAGARGGRVRQRRLLCSNRRVHCPAGKRPQLGRSLFFRNRMGGVRTDSGSTGRLIDWETRTLQNSPQTCSPLNQPSPG